VDPVHSGGARRGAHVVAVLAEQLLEVAALEEPHPALAGDPEREPRVDEPLRGRGAARRGERLEGQVLEREEPLDGVAQQTVMILGIAELYGATPTKALVAEILLPFSATMVGRTASQFLLGWLPTLGNVLNAVTAASLTEAIGWAADGYFKEAAADRRAPT
jgi:hypothetical protein